MNPYDNFIVRLIDKKISCKIDKLTSVENEFVSYFNENPELRFKLKRLQNLYEVHFSLQKRLDMIWERFNEYGDKQNYLPKIYEFQKQIKEEKQKENIKTIFDFKDEYNKNTSIPTINEKTTQSTYDKMAEFINSKSKNDGKYMIMFYRLLNDRDANDELLKEKEQEVYDDIKKPNFLKDKAVFLEKGINKLIEKRNNLTKYKFIKQQPIESRICQLLEFKLLDYYKNAENEVNSNPSHWIGGASIGGFSLKLDSEIPPAFMAKYLK